MKRLSGKLFVLAGIVLMAIFGNKSVTAQMMPHIEKRTIVVQGAGYFPVLIRLKTDRLLVVYRYGAPHRSVKGQLAVSWSDDSGKTWSSPVVAVSGESDHRNPSMVELPNGEIILSYTILSGYDATGRNFLPSVNGKDQRSTGPLWMVRSHDHGATWSAPEQIEGTRLLAEHDEVVNSYGKMAVMHNGSILMSVYSSSMGHHMYVEHIFRSTDSGHTWTMLSTIAKEVNETGILALRDNHVLAALRTDKEQKLLFARSADGGRTWDTPTAVTGPNEHPGDLIRLQNGDILLSFGERNAPRGTAALLSRDGGKTWDPKTRMVIADDAPSRDCGYPSSVQLPDGRIITVYYKVNDAATAPASTQLIAVIWRLPKGATR